MNSSEVERQRHIFRGRVQGVGFRYTAWSIAKRYLISGYVRNQRDGSVELVMEGPAESLEAVREQIEAAYRGNIEGRHMERLEGSPSIDGFDIRH